MKTMHKKKQNQNKETISSVITKVAGLATATAVVAGVGVAAGMALKDDETREKGKKILINAKDQAMDYIDKLRSEPNTKEKAKKFKKIAADTKKTIKKKKEEVS